MGKPKIPHGRDIKNRVVVYVTPEPNFADELLGSFRTKNPGIETECSHKSGGEGFVDFLAEMERGEGIPDVMLLNGQQVHLDAQE